MTDRELLEMAAKAAGIVVDDQDPNDEGLWVNPKTTPYGPAASYWNPLTDDGDALRLAVALKLEIVPVSNGMVDVCLPSSNPFVCACERGNDDPYAATRRAIVRAAAEIGKNMK